MVRGVVALDLLLGGDLQPLARCSLAEALVKRVEVEMFDTLSQRS